RLRCQRRKNDAGPALPPLGLRLAPRFSLLVDAQPAAVVLQGWVVGWEPVDGPRLPRDRMQKVARLGIGGGQSAQLIRVRPVGENAGACGLGNRLGSRTQLLVGAGCPDPGPAVVRCRILRCDLKNPVVVFQGMLALPERRPGPRAG